MARLRVYRSFVRPEDEQREEAPVQDADGANAMGQGVSANFMPFCAGARRWRAYAARY